jgi:hypothetical protein
MVRRPYHRWQRRSPWVSGQHALPDRKRKSNVKFQDIYFDSMNRQQAHCIAGPAPASPNAQCGQPAMQLGRPDANASRPIINDDQADLSPHGRRPSMAHGRRVEIYQVEPHTAAPARGTLLAHHRPSMATHRAPRSTWWDKRGFRDRTSNPVPCEAQHPVLSPKLLF